MTTTTAMKMEEQGCAAARDAYEVRALTKGTERLLKLLDEFSLLPLGAFDSRFQWRLVSQPDEKRLILCVDWE